MYFHGPEGYNAPRYARLSYGPEGYNAPRYASPAMVLRDTTRLVMPLILGF